MSQINISAAEVAAVSDLEFYANKGVAMPQNAYTAGEVSAYIGILNQWAARLGVPKLDPSVVFVTPQMADLTKKVVWFIMNSEPPDRADVAAILQDVQYDSSIANVASRITKLRKIFKSAYAIVAPTRPAWLLLGVVAAAIYFWPKKGRR